MPIFEKRDVVGPVEPLQAESIDGFAYDWAWDDIHKVLLALMLKGDFSTWMKDGNTFITCCTGSSKPVVLR